MSDVIDFSSANITNEGGQQFLGKFNNVIANLNMSGNQEFGDALVQLQEAVQDSEHLSDKEKQEQLDVIHQIGEEVTKTKPNKTFLKILGDGLIATLKTIPDVAKAAAALAPFLATLLSK